MAVHVSADVDPRVLARPSVRPYTERDGLPQGTIHAIAFDAQGFLWVGTQDGAARFNGRAWTRVDMPDRSVSNFVRAVLPARDGSLWFGREEGGLVRLREGVATLFDRAEGLPASRVNHLLEAADGGIWAATHGGGVARFTGAGFEPVDEGLPDLRVWQLLEGKGSGGGRRLLAACEGGVAELVDGNRWTSLDLGTSLAGVSVNSLLETGEGEERALWAGTFGAGLLRLEKGRVSRFGPEGGLSSRFITSLAAIPGAGGAPVVWAGTRDAGVFRSRGAAFEPVVLGASTKEIYSLAGGVGVDADTLWIGTRVSGLLRVQEAPWAALDVASGLPGDQVYCFLEESRPGGRAAIWIGTNSGAAALEDGRVEAHGPETGLPAAQVRSLASYREGSVGRAVWASVVGSGPLPLRWPALERRRRRPFLPFRRRVGPPRRRRWRGIDGALGRDGEVGPGPALQGTLDLSRGGPGAPERIRPLPPFDPRRGRTHGVGRHPGRRTRSDRRRSSRGGLRQGLGAPEQQHPLPRGSASTERPA
ncbi:MAG: hypothetical protein IPF66_21335 [Holophagales bacterium]|nr:hypothetical protein [Holophagales bacterium]